MSAPHEVLVVGAGFGGIGMAIMLRRAGFEDVVVLERDAELGGTWRDNTYPGAACDVPSHLYSFSFEPKHDWSRRFPQQPEILAYLRHCARKYGVLDRIRFGTEVTEASWDADAALWRVRTTGGELAARVLVPACGQLNRPSVPSIPGREAFTGPAFHTARWDHDVPIDGRSVAVVGTGASAIQIVPELAGRAARVTVYQRSAPYVMPKPDRPYRRWEHRTLRVPGAHALSRAKTYLSYEWKGLGFVVFPRLMKILEARFRRALRSGVHDPGLRDALIPDHPMGCKRILISNDYYAALTRPNVELVTAPIERITAGGVRTADARVRDADALVYATGFAASGFLAPMRVVGRDGRELGEEWRDGAEAHLGITVHGFPNMFLIYGPYTNLGHNSIIYMLESQFRYVLGCLRAMRGAGLDWVEVRAEVQSAFGVRMQEKLRGTVWDAGCDSWYKTADGRLVNNWPGFTFTYRRATRRPDPREFTAGRRR